MADATNRKPDVKNSDLDHISRDDPLYELSQIIGYSTPDEVTESQSPPEDALDLESELIREIDDPVRDEPATFAAEAEVAPDRTPASTGGGVGGRFFGTMTAAPREAPRDREAAATDYAREQNRAPETRDTRARVPQSREPLADEALVEDDAMEAELLRSGFEPAAEPAPRSRSPEPVSATQSDTASLEDELLDLLGSIDEPSAGGAAHGASAEAAMAQDLDELASLFSRFENPAAGQDLEPEVDVSSARDYAPEPEFEPEAELEPAVAAGAPASAPKPFWLEDDDAEEVDSQASRVAEQDDALLDAFENEFNAGLSVSFDEGSDEASFDEREAPIEEEVDLDRAYGRVVDVEPDFGDEVRSAAISAPIMAPRVDTADLSDAEIEAMRPLSLPDLPVAEDVRHPPASNIERELDVALSDFDHYDDHVAPVMDEDEGVEEELVHDDDFGAFKDDLARDMEDDLARDMEYAAPEADLRDDEIEFGDYDGGLSREADRAPASRGMMIAAVVGGVAILGAIGAFMLSGGDTVDNSGPVLVQADPDPVKVVPEDPGGVQVPNQNRVVYGEVDGNGETAPTQETLVTTTEEPIDLGGSGALLPSGVSETAKVEERLTPDANAEAGTPQDGSQALLPPHRVRTVIVKPDGTIVSTPAPQAAAEVTETAAAASTQPQVEQGAGGTLVPSSTVSPSESQALQEMAAASGTTTSETPPAETQSRNVTTPTVIPQRPQSEAVETVAAAPSVAAAPQPVATSEYSVQISSQPSRELAQASSLDLSRRYGDILGGRAITIQQADIEGKGTFHRVRVAATSRADAVALCEELKRAGGSCFVAR